MNVHVNDEYGDDCVKAIVVVISGRCFSSVIIIVLVVGCNSYNIILFVVVLSGRNTSYN